MDVKINKQSYLSKKYVWIILAVNMLGVSINCYLVSGLGCDPIALLSNGISEALSISFGTASFFYNLLTIVLACIFAKKFLGAGTIAYGLLSGFVIDMYGFLFRKFAIASGNMISDILFFAVGEILMAAAFSILINLELGMTALDALLTALADRTDISYTILKIWIDVIFVVTGIFLGGSFGIGTLVSALVTGMLVTRIGRMIKSRGKTHEKKAVQL